MQTSLLNIYWQIELNEESSKLFTINTIFSRYYFLRLPFGLCSSVGIEQRALENIMEGIETVNVIVDGILVWGSYNKEHGKQL